MIVFSSLNLVIFILISLLHIYWALGGSWGLEGVVPQLKDGTTVFEPPLIATIIVAGGLFGFALIHAGALGMVSFISTYYLLIALVIIATIFTLRAIGDFKYVGLFKKQRAGAFAQNDTRYYIPLCLFISFNAWMTYYLL